MQDKRYIWYHLTALIVALIWGETFVNTKILTLHGMTPAEIFVVRFFLAYVCIWFVSPKRLFCNNWKDELWMVLLGITGGSLYFVTENMAVKLTYVNNVSFIVSTAPPTNNLIEFVLFQGVKERRDTISGP